jgi:hypothetical protein
MSLVEDLLKKTRFKKVGDKRHLLVVEPELPPIVKLVLPAVTLHPSEDCLKFEVAMEQLQPNFEGLFIVISDPSEGFKIERYLQEADKQYEVVGPFCGEPREGRPEYRVYISPDQYDGFNPMQTGYTIGACSHVGSGSSVIQLMSEHRGEQRHIHNLQLFKRWFFDLYPNSVEGKDIQKMKDLLREKVESLND